MPIALTGRATRHGRRCLSVHRALRGRVSALPRRASILALVAAYVAAHPVGAQEQTSPPDPTETARILGHLREELAETRARLELLEDRIDRLSPRRGGSDAAPSNPVTFVRLDDEEHEFVSYPVHLDRDDSNTLLKRVGYVTYHDDDHRIPLWVSYKVSRQWLDEPAHIPRNKLRWRTDPELSGTGARDRDYRGSGYSRGHMAMQALLRGRSGECEREGFCFANAIPQRQSFNAGIWLKLEYQVMNWAREFAEVWVVCGPVLPPDPVKLNGRVSVPTGFYKIVTRDTPGGMEAAAYFFTQDSPGAEPTLDQCVFTIDAIETRTGLDFFASLPDEYESKIEALHSTLTAPVALARAGRAPPRQPQPRAPPSRAAGDARNSGPSQADVIVYVTRSGTRYHLDHCRYLRTSRTRLSFEKARSQYTPCSVCRPPS